MLRTRDLTPGAPGSILFPLLAVAIAALAAPLPAGAQSCGPQWLPGEALPGMDGPVLAATMWDPDGPGPRTPVLVVGGEFTVAGSVSASGIAAYDPATDEWSPFGVGMTRPAFWGPINGGVHALAVLPDGSLVAGGIFTAAGGVAAKSIARWDGSSWSPLGTGIASGNFSGIVHALAVLPGGDLVAGGIFSTTYGGPGNYIARWDGSTWSALGSGMAGGSTFVHALAVLPNGDLVAGGQFTTAGGVPANSIARWDGSAWSPLGTGMSLFGSQLGIVYALAVLPNGDLVAGGGFTSAGGVQANSIARWDGSAWSALGTGMSSSVLALAVLPNGDLVAGGRFTSAGGVLANGIARWDGTIWSALGNGVGLVSLFRGVQALAVLTGGDLMVGGAFSTAGGAPARGIARWNGSAWSPLGPGGGVPGVNSIVLAATTWDPDGAGPRSPELVVGGSFTLAGGSPANSIASWNGSSWSALGMGMSGPVRALAALANGNLVAGGSFTTAGGSPANNIARWDGSNWSPLGTGMTPGQFGGTVYALAVLPNGDLVAGGQFTSAGGVAANRIARWNGSTWSPLGTGMTAGQFGGTVYALAVLPNGDLVAGGYFTTAGGLPANHIARWDGSTWSPLGSGIQGGWGGPYVSALAVLPSGDLVAGGHFIGAGGQPADSLARWDGSAWFGLGSFKGYLEVAEVLALVALPGGDLILGGDFHKVGGPPNQFLNSIARWNGGELTPLALGMGHIEYPLVTALAVAPGGELVAGGKFTSAGGQPSAYLARWTETNIPWIAVQPDPQSVNSGAVAAFSCTPANGYSNLGAQWELETAPGSGVYSALGAGPIPGARPASASITLPAPGVVPGPTTLTISGVTGALHDRRVRVGISNACGGVTSDAALLSVGCYPDCNADGVLNLADFGCFQNKFALQDPYADCNADGLFNLADFGCFQTKFALGCP